MKLRFVTSLATAAALVLAPTAAAAQTQLPAAETRVGAALDDASELQGDARGVSIALGLLILVAILIVALSRGDGPDRPISP